jgi:hypothetical protein
MITITPKLAGLVAASAVALMAPAAFAAGPHKSVKAAHKSAAAVHQTAKAAAWSFPSCTGAATEYEYIYSGDPCTSAATQAVARGTILLAPGIESGVVSRTPVRRQSPAFCIGNAEYDYVYSGCQS